MFDDIDGGGRKMTDDKRHVRFYIRDYVARRVTGVVF